MNKFPQWLWALGITLPESAGKFPPAQGFFRLPKRYTGGPKPSLNLGPTSVPDCNKLFFDVALTASLFSPNDHLSCLYFFLACLMLCCLCPEIMVAKFPLWYELAQDHLGSSRLTTSHLQGIGASQSMFLPHVFLS